MNLGFVGTGVISGAVISALVRQHGEAHSIMVSPRSEHVSRGLETAFTCVRRAASNQEVIDNCDCAFIGVLPSQLASVAEGLSFRSDHTVISFVAGASLDHVQRLCQPAAQVVRVTPLPTIEYGKGPVIIHPSVPAIQKLFEGLGTVVVPENAGQVMTLGYASGMMATFFRMSLEAADWMECQGVPREMGRDYLFSMFEGLSATGLLTAASELGGLPARHMTEGGINEKSMNYLAEQCWFGTYRKAFEEMKEHLEGN